jgi:hypothetical protein
MQANPLAGSLPRPGQNLNKADKNKEFFRQMKEQKDKQKEQAIAGMDEEERERYLATEKEKGAHDQKKSK